MVKKNITDSDRHGIIALAKKNRDANSIRGLKRYSKYTRQQIAAIIAWVTMGKY